LIALDTNILLRFVADVDAPEGPAARRLIIDTLTPEEPGFISAVVLTKMIWILGRAYRISKDQQIDIVSELLKAPQLVVEHADAVNRALTLPHRDLADCILHEIGQAVGCAHTATFDRHFAKLDRVELVK